MKIQSQQLITDLKNATKEVMKSAIAFRALDLQSLNYRENDESWSMLECLEHLNLYGDFYLKEIENKILRAPEVSGASVFRSGFLGNYFAMMMLPKKGQVKKMQTFKDKNPIHSRLDQKTIERFLKQQDRLLELLDQAGSVDLSRTKTAISISKLVKLRLGDTLRVVVYHNQRHILQAQKVLKAVKAKKSVV